MVRVQMGDQHGLQFRHGVAHPVHQHRGRGAAVQQQAPIDQIAGVVPVHGEGGPAAQDGQHHSSAALLLARAYQLPTSIRRAERGVSRRRFRARARQARQKSSG